MTGTPSKAHTYLESAWGPGDSPESVPTDVSPDFFFWTASFLVLGSPSTVSIEGCKGTGLGKQRQAGLAGGKAGALCSPCRPSTNFPSLLSCTSGRAGAARVGAAARSFTCILVWDGDGRSLETSLVDKEMRRSL